MKWGKKYGSEYVNRLYAMVRRHLRGDFHFVCLTDDAAGIRSEVQCLPIPPLDLPAGEIAAFVDHYPLALDDAERAALDDPDRRLFAVMAGRVPDGDAAAAALAALLADASAQLPDDLGIAAERIAAASAVCRSWLAWYAELSATSSSPPLEVPPPLDVPPPLEVPPPLFPWPPTPTRESHRRFVPVFSKKFHLHRPPPKKLLIRWGRAGDPAKTFWPY